LSAWWRSIRRQVHGSHLTRRRYSEAPSRGRLGYRFRLVYGGRTVRVAPPPSGVVLEQVRPGPWPKRLPDALTHQEPARAVVREPLLEAPDPPPNASRTPGGNSGQKSLHRTSPTGRILLMPGRDSDSTFSVDLGPCSRRPVECMGSLRVWLSMSGNLEVSLCGPEDSH
jgi:hypothetical protein